MCLILFRLYLRRDGIVKIKNIVIELKDYLC